MADTTTNFNAFYAAEATLSTAAPTTINGRSVYRFNPPYGVQRIPIHIRTGANPIPERGGAMERKRFRQIEFHGKGSLYVRAYVDGIWIADSTVTMTESPSKDRRFGLPIGTRGYNLDIECCGDVEFLRAIEVAYDPMDTTS